MFWGLILESGKRYSTTVGKAFHISMATLECSSVKTESEVVSVMLEEGEEAIPYILCNLNKGKVMQSPLDLNFMTGDSVTFFCKGNGTVHLSGYILTDEDDLSEAGLEEEDEEDEMEDWEEAEDEEKPTVKKDKSPSKGKKEVNGLTEKRKSPAQPAKVLKKPKLEKEEEEEDSDDENSDDEMMEGLKNWAAAREGDSSGEEEGEEEESDEGMDEDEEEEDSDGDLKVPPVVAPSSAQKKQEGAQKKKSLGPQTPAKQQQSPGNKGQKTPNGLPPGGQPGGTGQSGKKEKKKGGEGGGGEGGATSPQKKALEGGVTVKDIKVGNGPICKPGKMATVYYVGRLKSTNKVFDSTSSGPGFKFRVGRGEVIKGWDVGLQGMKVGGKRVITCPPHMAYGAKGMPPTIPSNSSLVFEVELKGVQ